MHQVSGDLLVAESCHLKAVDLTREIGMCCVVD
jgi:hypothetical protein